MHVNVCVFDCLSPSMPFCIFLNNIYLYNAVSSIQLQSDFCVFIQQRDHIHQATSCKIQSQSDTDEVYACQQWCICFFPTNNIFLYFLRISTLKMKPPPQLQSEFCGFIEKTEHIHITTCWKSSLSKVQVRARHVIICVFGYLPTQIHFVIQFGNRETYCFIEQKAYSFNQIQ